MQTISPASILEDWADAIILHEPADRDGGSAPEFALLDLRGPNPVAFLFACVWLSALVFLGTILSHPQRPLSAERATTITEITLPPEPLDLAENSRGPSSPEVKPSEPQPDASAPPTSEPLPDLPTPQPIAVSKPPATVPSVPAPTIEPNISSPAAPPTLQPEKASTPTLAIAAAAPKPQPEIASLPTDRVPSRSLKLLPASPAPTLPARAAVAETRNAVPEALGTLPLNSLLRDQAFLATQLASLPSDQRLALPQVWIRVNAEWFAALAQTHERLYFSLTTPGAESEVLAYLPATNHFVLERPQRPLWQVRDGEQVPALAALRIAAARQLGAPASLVGIYTWHPPVLESALRMFVFEQMRQLGVRLGPQDVVTVRLASGPGGCVMNLEPIRDDSLR